MKFHIVINTHKRPWQAIAVAETLRALQSGKHEVRAVIACDEEDPTRFDLLDYDIEKSNGCVVDVRPRPNSLQDCWNRNLNPDDADFFLPLPDDGFPAVNNWDEAIVKFAEQYPRPDLFVCGWHDTANPGQLTVPIVSSGWLRLIQQPLLDPRFPFWFSDTAIEETWAFTMGDRVPCPEYLRLVGKPFQPNPIMRDADLWWDLFAATRKERLATAQRIRKELGMHDDAGYAQRLSQLLVLAAARDREGRHDTHNIIATLDADPERRPPSAHYLKAKLAAIEYLSGV